MSLAIGVLANKTPAQNICSYKKKWIGMLYYFNYLNNSYNVWAKADLNGPQNLTKICGGLTTRLQVAPQAFAVGRGLNHPV